MEEFSFPTVVESQKPIFQLPFPTTSTLLMSSKPSPNNVRRSFSLAEGAFDITNDLLIKDFKPSSPALSDYGSGGQFLEDEERMDKLWEDFNDDFFCASVDRDQDRLQMMSRRLIGLGGMQRGLSVQTERHRALELQLLPALGASKSARTNRYKKPSLGVMLRVLKKLFIVQRTRQSYLLPATDRTIRSKRGHVRIF